MCVCVCVCVCVCLSVPVYVLMLWTVSLQQIELVPHVLDFTFCLARLTVSLPVGSNMAFRMCVNERHPLRNIIPVSVHSK